MRHGMCFPGCMNKSVLWSAFGAFLALGIGTVFAPPAVAAAPEISYSVEPDNPVARMPFRVTYEVRWDGGPESVGVIPAEPSAVAWGKARLAAATAVADDAGQSIRYTVEYVADRHGEMQIPPLALSYVLEPPLEERPKVVADASEGAAIAPEAKPVEPQSLEAPGFSVTVGRNVHPATVAGGIGAALVVAAGAFVAVRARRRRAARGTAPIGRLAVPALLNLARQHRLDGKFYEYYRELARASTLLAPSVAAKKLREKLEHHAQQVGYGALHPTEDDLEGAARDLDRVLQESKRTEQ